MDKNLKDDLNKYVEELNSQETKLTNEIYRKANLILKHKEELQKQELNFLNINFGIEVTSGILDFCSKKCNPFEVDNARICGRNCVGKYKEMFNVYLKNESYFKNTLYLHSTYFNTDFTLKHIDKLA